MLLRSMTAYGRATASSSKGRITAELHTVNRKFLEINLNLPLELRRFDIDIRKWVAEKIWCGQVNINIVSRFQSHLPVIVTPNLALAAQVKEAWATIAREIGVDFEEKFSWDLLTSQTGILQYEVDSDGEESCRALLKEAVDLALKHLVEMKLKEAMLLRIDLEERLTHILRTVDRIEENVRGTPKKQRDKLARRLEEILPGAVENEERLLRELVIYAERYDVDEELDRLRAHACQFEELLEGKEGGVGKTLDFLLQEMNREANTLAAKSIELEVSQMIVELKSTLVKLREQIQNVE